MTSANNAKPVAGALGLTIGALGVVFGDIGTSPLYAFEQVFTNTLHPVPVSEANVLGVLSLFAWSLLLVVTFKYVLFVMRFDNAGEGGIVALMTLLINKVPRRNRLRVVLFLWVCWGRHFSTVTVSSRLLFQYCQRLKVYKRYRPIWIPT